MGCTMEEAIAAGVDIVITTTGNKDIITLEHMSKMKNNCIVGNIGHFDNEIQMEKLEKATKRLNIKPQGDKFIFPDGHGVIILAEGRLLNLGSARSTRPPARTRRRASIKTRFTCCPKSSTRRSRACTWASSARTSLCLARSRLITSASLLMAHTSHSPTAIRRKREWVYDGPCSRNVTNV